MHTYYEANRGKLKKTMKGFLALVGPELERAGGKPLADALEDIWTIYERDMGPITNCKTSSLCRGTD